jgi:hypothetical protein
VVLCRFRLSGFRLNRDLAVLRYCPKLHSGIPHFMTP